MRKPPPSAAYLRFLGSMKLSMDDWRDGIGYDVAALGEIAPEERLAAVEVLAEHLRDYGDWRDVEALAAIDIPEARDEMRRATQHDNHQVRLRAAERLEEAGEDAGLEDQIIDALRGSAIFYGLTQALELAEEHPTERIKATLLDVARNGENREARVHCSALALYLGGKAKEAFDWAHRPLFLKFGEEDPGLREEAYRELCARLGHTPKV